MLAGHPFISSLIVMNSGLADDQQANAVTQQRYQKRVCAKGDYFAFAFLRSLEI